LKEILPHEGAEITAHTISRNRERAIGIFPRQGSAAREAAVGGRENRSFEVLRVTLLLRWGRDGASAEAKAAQIYNVMEERDVDIDGCKGFMHAVNAQPAWLGMDERGIFEAVIDFDVHVKKTNYMMSSTNF